MRNKALLYSLSEGGAMQPLQVDIYQDELNQYTNVEKRKVFVKSIQQTITTRSVKIGPKFVHSLFFEDGNVFDCGINGFLLREDYKSDQTKELFNRVYKEKTNG